MRALLGSFAAFAALQMGSGLVLFLIKAGAAPDEVARFYAATPPLQAAVPHLLALPLWVLTVAHLTVTLRPAEPLPRPFAPATAACALLVIAGGPLVRLHDGFAILKVAAVAALGVLAVAWLGLLVARLRSS
jgi:hypothetical protein